MGQKLASAYRVSTELGVAFSRSKCFFAFYLATLAIVSDSQSRNRPGRIFHVNAFKREPAEIDGNAALQTVLT